MSNFIGFVRKFQSKLARLDPNKMAVYASVVLTDAESATHPASRITRLAHENASFDPNTLVKPAPGVVFIALEIVASALTISYNVSGVDGRTQCFAGIRYDPFEYDLACKHVVDYFNGTIPKADN